MVNITLSEKTIRDLERIIRAPNTQKIRAQLYNELLSWLMVEMKDVEDEQRTTIDNYKAHLRGVSLGMQRVYEELMRREACDE